MSWHHAHAAVATALLAVVATADPPAPAAPQHVAPPSVPARFNAFPGMWGLLELEDDTALANLDDTFVLFVSERARFRIGETSGVVYLDGGRQFLSADVLSETDISEHLRASPCLCAIEFETTGSAARAHGELHVAAGAYRVAGAPTVTTDASGTVKVTFELSPVGQAERTRLRSLVCWIASDDTTRPVRTTLPAFAKLTRKSRPGFVDPPMDDRRVLDAEIVRSRIELDERHRVVFDDEERGYSRSFLDEEGRLLVRPGAQELLGPVRPGLLTWLREMGGDKRILDYSDYDLDPDPYLRSLDRRQGISFRDPWFWP